ncbi:MAG: hypothetical protein WCJ99_17355, partial [Betaproteobacteria bacterium]
MDALNVLRCGFLGLSSLVIHLQVCALSMVVTPGSSASYLYFPPALISGPASTNSTSTVLVAGVGGVSLSKAGG